MAITRNGPVEFQPMSTELNDSTMLFNWLNRASGSGGIGTAGLRSQQYANELLGQDRKRREIEQIMMQEGLAQIRSKNSGGGGAPRGAGIGGSASFGRDHEGTVPRGGGMSPHEQQQMQEQASARAAAAERAKLKQQRADDRLHMNNLLFDYEQAKKRTGSPGSSGGSRGNRGDEGYTEQIFNSAGAPEVVRLKNYTPDRGTEAADMQAIMNILMGAR